MHPPNQKIANLILTTISLERLIESQRRMLASNPEFKPYLLYNTLLQRNDSQITPGSIKSYLSCHQYSASLHQCRKLVRHYDIDENGELSLNEFFGLILPFSDPSLKESATKTAYQSRDSEGPIQDSLHSILCSILNLEIHFWDSLKNLLKLSSPLPLGVDIDTVFDLLSNKVLGIVSTKSLTEFFGGLGMKIEPQEITFFSVRVQRNMRRIERIQEEEIQVFLENVGLDL